MLAGRESETARSDRRFLRDREIGACSNDRRQKALFKGDDGNDDEDGDDNNNDDDDDDDGDDDVERVIAAGDPTRSVNVIVRVLDVSWRIDVD